MQIDRCDYNVNSYRYKNYVNLSEDEAKMVLDWRNNPEISKWMVTSGKISYESHISFIDALKNRNDAFYWLVYKENSPYASFNITKLDYDKNSVEVGYYLNPIFLNSGEGLVFHFNYKLFLYNVLGVEVIEGNVQWGNTRALQLSLFFGAKIIGIVTNGDKKYLKLETYKGSMDLISENTVIRQFIRYCKGNPVDWNNLMFGNGR